MDFVTRELDILIISATLGLEFLGVYNIAKRVPTAIYSFITPIVTKVFAPLLAEKQSDKTVLKYNYMRLSKALSWVSFPMYMLLAAISPTVISVIFGLSYLEGVPVMMVFCIRYAFNGVNGVCGALQTATGRTDIGLIWTIYLIISTAVVYYITSMLGIVAFLIGICLLTLINVYAIWYIQFRPMVDVKLSEYLNIYIRSFLISLLLSLIVHAIYSSPSIAYSICASVFFAMLFMFTIMKTTDGKEIVEVIRMIKVPAKAIVIVERIVD